MGMGLGMGLSVMGGMMGSNLWGWAWCSYRVTL